jgi:thioredoxin reductase (NADPH)
MVNNTKNNEKQFYDVDGVFIFAGRNPESSFIGDLVERDEKGYINIDYESMKTSCEGIFSAGDVREGSLRQITTAVSDGAISAYSAYKYINGELKW